MSGPSVWNGRNVSILGPSTDSSASISTLPTSNVDRSNKSNSDGKGEKKDVNNNNSKSAPANAPTRSVWNGKHDKIMEIRDASKPSYSGVEANTSNVSVAVDASKTKNCVTLTKKKKGANNNGANSKNNNKVVLPASLPKDAPVVADEGTNSTAGSSTTNTLNEEDNHRSSRSVDGSHDGVVVDVVQDVTASPSNTSSLATEDDTKGSASGDKKEKASDARATQAPSNSTPPVVSVGENKKNKGKADTSAAATAGGAKANHAKKGGKSDNNKYNQQNSGHRSRSNSSSGGKQHGNAKGSSGNGGRRKSNNSAPIHNPGALPCAFYIRGMCNRGESCTFKHDPAMAPTSAYVAAPINYNPHNKLLRNGSMPPSGAPSSMPYNRLGSGRVFDPLKAKAIQLAKDAQDKEDRSIFASPFASLHQEVAKEPTGVIDPPLFSIDVECIATGYGSCAKGINDGCGNEGKNREGVPTTQYNDLSHRYPGRVAVVDSNGTLLADIIIRPPKNGKGVVSYLTALTGLTEEMCLGSEAKLLEEAVATIKSLLPKNGVLVGQSIDHDVEWLGLTPGKDFERMVDLSVIFRQRMPAVLAQASALLKAGESGNVVGNKAADPSSDEYLGFETRYRYFSLRHVCLNLLGKDIQSGVHDPVVDAQYSLNLFHKYRNSSVTQLRIVRDGLHRAPVTPGFAAEKTPVLDGVCVSAAGYTYKRAGRKIWRWYSGKKGQQSIQSSS